eukprot:4543227-Prymnesium_polylepis.1
MEESSVFILGACLGVESVQEVRTSVTTKNGLSNNFAPMKKTRDGGGPVPQSVATRAATCAE